MTISKAIVRKPLRGLACLVLVLGMSNIAFAQSHEGGSHGGGGHHDTTVEDHAGGCSGGHESGGCGDSEHETTDEDHEGGGKGPMFRGGDVIRGHQGGAGHGDLHDIFEQMEGIEGHTGAGEDRDR